MKRFLVIVIVALFGFAFGCGGAKAPEATPPAETPEVGAPTTEEGAGEATETPTETPAAEEATK